jgi:hypothetical protein
MQLSTFGGLSGGWPGSLQTLEGLAAAERTDLDIYKNHSWRKGHSEDAFLNSFLGPPSAQHHRQRAAAPAACCSYIAYRPINANPFSGPR